MPIVKTQLDRRSFLKASGVAGGGMLLGISWLAGCQPKEIQEATATLKEPEIWFEMNGFVKIGDNGLITIMSPNPEGGQNVKTSMPMIVAEELDIDWKKVTVEQAPLNTELYSRQFIGGSQAIPELGPDCEWQEHRFATCSESLRPKSGKSRLRKSVLKQASYTISLVGYPLGMAKWPLQLPRYPYPKRSS